MTPEQLNEIEARASAATQGPWEVYDRGIGCEIHIKGAHDDGEEYSVPINNGHRETFSKADAEFIATARTDVPALVAEVRRLQAQVATGKSFLSECITIHPAKIGGVPAIGGKRLTITQIVNECFQIESTQEYADYMGLTRQQVLIALWHASIYGDVERSRGGTAFRKFLPDHLGQWAEKHEAQMWRGEWDQIPDPQMADETLGEDDG